MQSALLRPLLQLIKTSLSRYCGRYLPTGSDRRATLAQILLRWGSEELHARRCPWRPLDPELWSVVIEHLLQTSGCPSTPHRLCLSCPATSRFTKWQRMICPNSFCRSPSPADTPISEGGPRIAVPRVRNEPSILVESLQRHMLGRPAAGALLRSLSGKKPASAFCQQTANRAILPPVTQLACRRQVRRALRRGLTRPGATSSAGAL